MEKCSKERHMDLALQVPQGGPKTCPDCGTWLPNYYIEEAIKREQSKGKPRA